MDFVCIDELELDCIVGLRPHERTRTQRIRLDLSLELDTRTAARTGRIDATADYDRVAHEVVALLCFRRYLLVEMAVEELCGMLLGVHRSTRSIKLRLEKPGALEGRARAAAVEVFRTRADYELPSPEAAVLTYPQPLVQTHDAELWLTRVAPGAAVPEPTERERRVLSWVVTGELCAEDGTRFVPGLAENCERDSGPALVNRGERDAILFRAAVLTSSDG